MKINKISVSTGYGEDLEECEVDLQITATRQEVGELFDLMHRDVTPPTSTPSRRALPTGPIDATPVDDT